MKKKSNILIVEASAMNRAAIVNALDGCNIVESISAEDALKKIQEFNDVFDVVVYNADQIKDSDLSLLKMQGTEKTASSVYMIALISQDSELMIEDAMRAGADLALTRPFDIAKIQGRVARGQA